MAEMSLVTEMRSFQSFLKSAICLIPGFKIDGSDKRSVKAEDSEALQSPDSIHLEIFPSVWLFLCIFKGCVTLFSIGAWLEQTQNQFVIAK